MGKLNQVMASGNKWRIQSQVINTRHTLYMLCLQKMVL